MSNLDEIGFEFDHSNLNMIELQKIGIRSPHELETVILGESFCESVNFPDIGELFFATGFNSSMRALVVVFKYDQNRDKLVTLDAKIANLEEIKNDFCKHCK